MQKTGTDHAMSRHNKKTKNFGERGFFGIGIYEPENVVNVGGLWRSAMLLGASFVYTIGKPYKRMRSDTQKAYRHIPLFYFDHFEHFLDARPRDSQLVAVEQSDSAFDIVNFVHPERATYLLGTEEEGLPAEVLAHAYQIVEIPSSYDLSLNVHVAGSIVMYDRLRKNRV